MELVYTINYGFGLRFLYGACMNQELLCRFMLADFEQQFIPALAIASATDK